MLPNVMRNEELTSMEMIKIHDERAVVTCRSFVMDGRETETMMVSSVLIKAASERHIITGIMPRCCPKLLFPVIRYDIRG
jgi:hypothetical protein